MNKTSPKIVLIVISAFIVGVILTVFVYQAITIYQFRAQYEADHATLTQVVSFLNQNIQQQQAQSGAAQASGSSVK